MPEGYCVKERKKVEIKDPQQVTMKNGRPAIQGTCPDCGTKIFKIGKQGVEGVAALIRSPPSGPEPGSDRGEAGLTAAVEVADERLDTSGSNWLPALARQLGHRLVVGHRLAVGAVRGHRVIGVAGEDDARARAGSALAASPSG